MSGRSGFAKKHTGYGAPYTTWAPHAQKYVSTTEAASGVPLTEAQQRDLLVNQLCRVIRAGDLVKTKALLEDHCTPGKEANADDGVGMSPWRWACDGGDIRMMTLLMAHGADVESTGPGGYVTSPSRQTHHHLTRNSQPAGTHPSCRRSRCSSRRRVQRWCNLAQM